jgi:hypothetical protein
MDQVKIDGTKYSRDLNNRAVVCDDRNVLENYYMEQRKHHDNTRRDKEINSLKDEMSEIKYMLKILMERG